MDFQSKTFHKTSMKIFKSLENLPPEAKDTVIAIGNFDGVHRGHQALLGQAKDIAVSEGKSFGVLTFEPHPRRLFRPDDPPSRITPPEVKHWRLAEFGVDFVVSLPFDWDFASQSAADFITGVLLGGLHPHHIIIGEDFRFGQLRKGEPEDIRDAGIALTTVEKITGDDGKVFSSSAVRSALRIGDLNAANEILGWNWEIRGQVVKGDQRGRQLGYPTANVALHETVHPAYGVYATRVQIDGEDEWHNAATNIGIRPMFEVPTAQVESFIFDFDREIYGKTLRIQPVQRLRGEAKFTSLDALTDQIEKDCAQAREILSRP